MIPNEFWESSAPSEAEDPKVGDLSDDTIAIGAAYGIPSHIREFIRRKYPDVVFKSEEQIALEDEQGIADIRALEGEISGENLPDAEPEEDKFFQ